jgi:GNAT superfamily N-acetyltransferase
MPTTDVTLRSATETDVPAILALIQALADYENLRDACVATEESLRATLFCDQPWAKVTIAELPDERIAGFALYCSNYSTFLARPGIWLEDLFVYPEFRGRGIGRKLLAQLARHAVEQNFGRLDWNVLDWNTPSIAFYESLGALRLTEWNTFRLTGGAMTALAMSDA